VLVEDEAEQDDCKPDGRASRALNARPSKGRGFHLQALKMKRAGSLSAWVSLATKEAQSSPTSRQEPMRQPSQCTSWLVLFSPARPAASAFPSHWIVSVTCVECCVDPEVPVIVIVYWPFGVPGVPRFCVLLLPPQAA
jgi:hypothetical protein